jgi:hypothetical protein
MGVVCVEKNGHVGFFAHAVHDSGKLARTKEISLSFGGAYSDWNLDFTCGCENCFQQDEVSDIEVPKGRSFFFKLRQNIS